MLGLFMVEHNFELLELILFAHSFGFAVIPFDRAMHSHLEH